MTFCNGHCLNPQLPIKLQGQILEQVSSSKYLDTYLNIDLNFDLQWIMIQTNTQSLRCHMKKLKHIGFNTSTLSNVYRSLCLNHFIYSDHILASISKSSKILNIPKLKSI